MFQSFFIAGFECSCHRRRDGRRLDLIAATGHDRFAAADYARVRDLGMRTVRDGVRWPLIETSPGRWDFSSLLPRVRAARDAGVQVIWDLCHYGWPNDLDVFRPEFVDRFADFAGAVARLIAGETDGIPWYTPVNEISFCSWAGGDVAYFNPFAAGRGFELKTQFARAFLAGTDVLWSVDARAQVLSCEPAIHIVAGSEDPQRQAEAEGRRLTQYQAWDLILGRLWPQLGGDERYLEVLGLNYYPQNQWVLDGPEVRLGDPEHRPFREILREVWERYGRPLILSETGAQDGARAEWLRYVAAEVLAARRQGVPVHGICLYPILDYPGWDDDRHCCSGLWGYPGPHGEREAHGPLVDELRRQMEIFRSEAPVQGEIDDDDPARMPGEEESEHAAF